MALSARLLTILQQAVERQRAGDLAGSENLFREALRIDPRQPDALHYLGVLIFQKGQKVEGLRLVEQSLALKSGDPTVLNSRGIMLGALGRPDAALASFELAISLNPRDPVALTNRANLLHELRRDAEAVDCYDRTIALAPGHAEAHVNRANALVALGRHAEALAGFERALALQPGMADGHLNHAITLEACGRRDQAVVAFRRVIALRPDHADAHYRLARTLERLGRNIDAVASYDRALALRPDHAAAWNNRGAALGHLFRFTEARDSFERALAAQPDHAEAMINLASRYHHEGRHAEAIGLLDRRLAADPSDPRARLLRTMHALPVIYRDAAEVEPARAEYAWRLDALRREIDAAGEYARFAPVVGVVQPFRLPYQGRNDRDLQQIYGELICRIAATRAPEPELPRAVVGERIRVGIVSSFFLRHTVWHLMLKGWLGQLDRQRFEVLGYHTVGAGDDVTEAAAGACDRFKRGPRPLAEWRQTIVADAPHVLLYPEIGMDVIAAQLAAQRLARVQCTSWGHPETSGFPTLDYFLTSDAMEPPDGEAAYTERLVQRLPSAPYSIMNRRRPGARRCRGGNSGCATMRRCSGAASRCSSICRDHDDVFARIAREVPDAQFAFIAYQHGPVVTDIFRARLRDAFSRFGLDADKHCVIVPRFTPENFAAAFAVCDVVLDSIGWSGGRTTLQSLPHNRPIVALVGPLMRGRHSSAMLELMGIPEMVAATEDEYVAIAARLGHDAGLRAAIGGRIAAAQHRLYRDRGVIDELEAFLERAATQVPPAGKGQWSL